MKIIYVLLTIVLLSTQNAMAINKEWSAVLGFVGGVLVSEAYNRETSRVVYERRPSYDYERVHVYNNNRYDRRTRYIVHEETRFIPPTTITTYDECGRLHTDYYPAHYRTYRKKVYHY
jgi:hypothetical protein